MDGPAVSLALLAPLFFLSGAIGLAYEVAWSRGLLLLVGSTAGAAAAVLAVFVGGLGLGAAWGGPRADAHPRPLAFYGWLEILAGVWALLSLPLIGWMEGPYVAVASSLGSTGALVLRLVLTAVVVLPVSFLLGATLPAMVREVTRHRSGTARHTAWLYGLNTLGAVLGCLATGFVLVEALGVQGTLYLAGGVGIALGIAALLLAREGGDPPRKDAAGAEGWPRHAVALAALCGFLGLGVEIAGLRILVFFLEGFTVTFAAMLGVFIAGLGAGSLLLGARFVRGGVASHRLGWVLMAAATCLAVEALWVLPNLDGWITGWKRSGFQEAADLDAIGRALRHVALLGAFVFFFVPAFLLGPTFALCVRMAEDAGASPGRAVGRTYIGNAAGSVLAAVGVGFVLVPLLGPAGAWWALVLLALTVGLALGPARSLVARLPGPAAWALPAAIWLGGCALLAAQPDIRSGASLLEVSHVLCNRPDRTILAVETDGVTTASVVEEADGERILYTDDFAAAATGRHYRYMRVLGHLPAVLAARQDHAMVIAFGTGTTAGAVAAHRDVKRLEVVEVSPAVLSLAPFFAEANRHVLEDPRVVVVEDDGRHALLAHAPDLDLITLEPLMPYSPAGLPFYTREFYELARDRLRDGGVLCQWIPVHAMRADLYAAFVRTFAEVFPDGEVYFFEQSSALIARKGTRAPSRAEIQMRLDAVQEDLSAAGFSEPQGLLEARVATGHGVLSGGVPPGPFGQRLVTDGDPFPEFHPTPRANLNTSWLGDTLAWLSSLAPHTERGMGAALQGRAFEARAEWHGVFAASRTLAPALRARELARRLEALDQAATRYAKALVDLPRDRVLALRRVRALRLRVLDGITPLIRRRAEGAPLARADLERMERQVRRVLPPLLEDPAPAETLRADAARLHAALLLRRGRCESAAAVIQEALAVLPESAPASTSLRALQQGIQARRTGGVQDRQTSLDAWVLADAASCGPDGTALLRDSWQPVEDALTSGARSGVLRSRLEALVREARAQGTERWALALLAPHKDRAASETGVLLAAAMTEIRDAPGAATDPMLSALTAADVAMRVAAWKEIARRRWTRHYRLALPSDASPAEVRVAFANAVGAASDKTLLCHVVRWIPDPDAQVREAAAAALFRHVPAILGDFDPRTSTERDRLLVQERIRQHLGCPR